MKRERQRREQGKKEKRDEGRTKRMQKMFVSLLKYFTHILIFGTSKNL